MRKLKETNITSKSSPQSCYVHSQSMAFKNLFLNNLALIVHI